MLHKRLFGGVMVFLCLAYSVILPILIASNAPASMASQPIAKSNHPKSELTPTGIQQPVQPPRINKQPVVARTENPVSNQPTALPKAVPPAPAEAVPAKPAATLSDYQFEMLVRIISAEAKGEPLEGQVAVGAVILNRIQSGKFPNTVSGNVLIPGQFEPVTNGNIWRSPVTTAYRAARLALNGWDPSYGALYFYNPAKSTSRWIWSRRTIIQIGDHVFAA